MAEEIVEEGETMTDWAWTNRWYQYWRQDIDMAKSYPHLTDYYSRVAAIHQMCYVIALAFENVRAKSTQKSEEKNA